MYDNMSLMEYENQIFLEALEEDGLLIVARGLGMERIFINFLKLYCDPGKLVIVLNTHPEIEEYFIEMLAGTNPLPRVITTEYSANDRQMLYMEGGVFFITSRIFVVDLLTNRVPTDLISGIIVYKAHKIIECCQEAFILRLFRQKNKNGFIKAFSDRAQNFTVGFCHVERVMKSLFIDRLFLLPRYHAAVVSCMDAHKVDTVELLVPMTSHMVACQTALLDLIAACIKELKICNTSLDTDEITVEYAITRSFDKIVHLHLDPIWHQLSTKSKQLISDIKALRTLLENLTQYDCVSFFNHVNSIKSNEKFHKNSGWLFLGAADSLFVNAKLRVYGESKTKTSESAVYTIEECPKWQVLKDVLKEIQDDIESDKELSPTPTDILVVTEDERSCNYISEYLNDGGQHLLQRLFHKTITLKNENLRAQEEQQQHKRSKIDNTDASGDDTFDKYCLLEYPRMVLVPLHGKRDSTLIVKLLEQMQPNYVVMYSMDITFVRQLEVYRASHAGQFLRVFVLMYDSSIEEQRYLTSLRHEKEAFEYLIKAKANMVIPKDRDDQTSNDPGLHDITTTNNTRKGGLIVSKSTTPRVIVDMREFRSELPSLLHRRGIDIEPVTLDVGDYILSPDTCVERKSLNDLIGSLSSGRLYNQATSMCRHYKRPILLIEFDANKPFSLQGKYAIEMGEINTQDTTAQLALLTKHFPRLRILWCPSPYATAELFQELKEGYAEPNAAQAMAITDEQDSSLIDEKYNIVSKTVLLKMPGINSKNVFIIMNKICNMGDLVKLGHLELTNIIGNENQAKILHEFIHKDGKHTNMIASSINKPQNTKRPNFAGVKRKK